MIQGETYLALDLGAESGRAVLGVLEDGKVSLEEIVRFPNQPVQVLGNLHWDVLFLWQEIKNSLARFVDRYGRQIDGIAVDTWGQDYALLDHTGALLGLPYHYRDSRTQNIVPELKKYVSEWELYTATGISFFPVSTLCQLLAARIQGSSVLGVAQDLLLMSGLFTYWLSGQRVNETSAAGITQLYDLSTGRWNQPLLDDLHIPLTLTTGILPTSTRVGPIHPSLAAEVGLDRADVFATAGHDTAAAVAAIPTQSANSVFISSGTWSVVGRVLNEPLLTRQAMNEGFLNEVGACGKYIFAYNSVGLWPVQECRREWSKAGQHYEYADLVDMARQAPAFGALLNPDAAELFRPSGMLDKIAGFCRRTGQEAPSSPGEVVRALLEGLAFRYRKTIDSLEAVTGLPTQVIHLVGGGSRNQLLCQLTADATGVPLLAGPAEATASGNILLQALARGSLSSLDEVKEVVARSTHLVRYEPQNTSMWDERYKSFLRISENEPAE